MFESQMHHQTLIMILIQTELQNGTKRMITFLPYDKRVKAGKFISLEKRKDSLDKDTTIWLVLYQYGSIDSTHINRGWNNNI